MSTKRIIIVLIRVLAVLLGLICIPVCIKDLSGNYNYNGDGYFFAVILLFMSIMTYGFSYVVEAACKYLDEDKENNNV